MNFLPFSLSSLCMPFCCFPPSFKTGGQFWQSSHIHCQRHPLAFSRPLHSLWLAEQGQARLRGQQDGGEVEGNRAHIAATCLPRKGKASHSCEGRERPGSRSGQPPAWDVGRRAAASEGPLQARLAAFLRVPPRFQAS